MLKSENGKKILKTVKKNKRYIKYRSTKISHYRVLVRNNKSEDNKLTSLRD
jgi:hypothetical protein